VTARAPLPPALSTAPFGVQDARELGVPPGRLRARDLLAPFRSVRTHVLDWSDISAVCSAYAVNLAPEQLFSHVTAARLLGVPLPWRLESREAIDVWAPEIQPRGAGVIGHRSAPVPSFIVNGLPVVAPARVWIQLGPLLGQTSLVAAGDYLVQRKQPLASLTDLAQAVDAAVGVRGVRSLRVALGLVRAGTDSPMETRLRLLLVRAGLPEPVIHHPIFDWTGGYVGAPDLAYVSERIALEYEGDGHRTDPAVFADDIERRERMQEAGWYVIRVIKGHVFERPGWLIDRVRRQLRERASLPLLP